MKNKLRYVSSYFIYVYMNGIGVNFFIIIFLEFRLFIIKYDVIFVLCMLNNNIWFM